MATPAAAAAAAAAVATTSTAASSSTAPRIVAAAGGLAARLASRVPALRQYVPSAIAPGPTHRPFARAITLPASYARQLVPLPDSGTVALDWWTGPSGWPGEAGYARRPPPLPPTAPVLLILHGLTGGGREGYVKGSCAAAAAAGWRPAVLTYRGCGGLALTSPRPYTATWTADVAAAVAAAGAAYPAASALAAVGFSLGAVILTKYVAEAEAGRLGTRDVPVTPPPLTAAVAISSPFCLSSASAKLSVPWTVGRLYNRVLAARLRSYFKEHADELAAHPAVRAALDAGPAGPLARARLVGDWDRAVVAEVAGHADAEAYYAAASSAAHIPAIARTPTLFVAAADDPFLGALPEVEVASAPTTALVVTQAGGHCAFLQGKALGRSWADDVLVQWLEAVVAEGREGGRGGRARL